ncbi:hypothetical protein DNU06_05850 [Putridiphycobacter roseus]|uniref:Uncharacterized protein n=1 Tax=Putridiphycobacter roseus TaxID=2219161 RepID=A0A2W1N0N2_9FLAO|nr:hypothetical protein [Putridiphycobacter roseus]PZE18139.1 hypothetical protein DNU06_05850 [Putridiphycobacter roseus]
MKIILLLLFILSINYSYSQDYILKKNGNKIKVKIVEIQTEKIKFLRYSDLDGPTYSIKKEKVAKIIYENKEVVDIIVPPVVPPVTNKTETVDLDSNRIKYLTVHKGNYYEGGIAISKKEFLKILSTNPYASNELQRRRNLITGAITCIFVGTATGVLGVLNGPYYLVQTGSSLITTGIIVGLFAPTRFWKAVEEYNRGLDRERV